MTAWSPNFEEFNHVTRAEVCKTQIKYLNFQVWNIFFSQTCPLGFLNLIENEENNPEAIKTAGRNVVKVTGKYLYN